MKKMSIVVISDSHGKYKQLTLPSADMIIHCGDMTSIGKEHEIHDFFKWYSKLDQYRYKLCIAGNHDWLFERNKLLALSHKPDNVIYLEDNGVEIEGIKFYGTPVSKPFCDWAFNRMPEKLEEHWKAIPDDTDILITHAPPHSILDYVPWNDSFEGSPSLRIEVLNRIKPIAHLMGHIHEGYGIEVINDITFINASNLNSNYDCINKPIIIEIIDKKVIVVT